jgi:hypothetical protein
MEAASSDKFVETNRTINETLLGFHDITKAGEKYFLLQFLTYFTDNMSKQLQLKPNFWRFGVRLPLRFNFFH